MNYATFIVKLINPPNQVILDKDIRLTEVFALISTKFKKQKRKKAIVKLAAWGDLSDVLLKYYQQDDLLVIDGIVSLRDTTLPEAQKNFKNVEITLASFYPYQMNGAKTNT